ncbi:hypothetical protein LINPERPRIM_LOCUS13943 [Linum perenne]
MKVAKYACGILSLLAGGDVEKEEGLRFLEGVRKADDVRECRNMVKFVMDNNMWVNGDGGTELEKKKKNEVVVPRCGCLGRFERHVMQNATILDKFYRRGCIEQHRADYSRFMAECVDSENPKTLLCLGIEYYFYVGRDEGILNLRFLTEKDMKAANYVCEILSLLTGGNVEKEEGLRFLEGVRKADDVRECRNMVKFVMDINMWVNGDRWSELEKKKKNMVVVPRCGCVGRLRCFNKNPDY